MKHSLPVTGCVVVLVVLAGCGGTVGSGPTTSEPSTPAAVPTDEPLTSPPDGLSSDGLESGVALVEAHSGALEQRSFTLRFNRTIVAANGSQLYTQDYVQRVSANRSRLTSTTVVEDPRMVTPGNVTQYVRWFNGTHAIGRVTTTNDTQYGVQSATTANDVTDVPFRGVLGEFYTARNSSQVTSQNGSIRLVLTGTGEQLDEGVAPAVTVTEWTATGVLAASGRVESFRVRYTGALVSAPATTVTGEVAVQFTKLGETRVTRPEWVEAVQNTTTSPATST